MSEDLPVEDDLVVRTALQLLPVPAHRDGFWSDLDRALVSVAPSPAAAGSTSSTPATEAAAVSAAGDRPTTQPVPVVELEHDPALKLVPPALRRRSNAVVALAAVAAAVLVVVAGAALLEERGGTDVDTSEVAGSAPQAGTEATAAETSLAAPKSADEGGDPERAVFAWIAAVEQSDVDTAWDSLGPAAQAHIGSREAFEGMRTDLAEGYGAWAATTPEQVLVTPLGDRAGAATYVVTLVGEVEQEGSRQRRADAFVVRVVDGAAELEPFDAAGVVELVVPDAMAGPSQTIDDGELVVVVPTGATAPVLRLDGGEPLVCGEAPGTELTRLETADGQRCAYRPDGGIPAGRRVLTVAFTSADGQRISAESALFEAA